MPDDHMPRRDQQDKERSRQQSRPVTGRQAPRPGDRPAAKSSAPKGGAAKGGQAPQRSGRSAGAGKAGTPGTRARPPRRPPPGGRPGGRRPPAFFLTWGAVAVVVVIVLALVLVKVTSSSSGPTGNPKAHTPLPASVASAIANVPASVFDKVGVTSQAPVTAPTVVQGTTPLTLNGKPGIFYLGGEFCPYCAAERWAMTVALSRFGSFSNLGEMSSSTTDAYPNTPTLTYYHSTYTSSYVSFEPVEQFSNVVNPATGSYYPLESLTAAEKQLLNTYYQPKYLPGVTAGNVAYPFVDIGNKVFVQAAGYSPAILQHLTREQIAQNLNDPTNPVTQAIVASANYLTAGICSVDGGQPSSVCTSKGVTAAAKALKLGS